MSSPRPSAYDRVVAHLAAHPGCSITELQEGAELRDAAEAWDLVITAANRGRARYVKLEGTRGWQLFPLPGPIVAARRDGARGSVDP